MQEQSPQPTHPDFQNDAEQEPTSELDPNALSKDLLRDFYQTFRLSQGEPAVQIALFPFLAEQHRQDGNQLYYRQRLI